MTLGKHEGVIGPRLNGREGEVRVREFNLKGKKKQTSNKKTGRPRGCRNLRDLCMALLAYLQISL